MKINRTFSLEYDLAQKLKRKPNQSRIVCKAVRRFLANEDQFQLEDLPSRRLLAILHARDDLPRPLMLLIEEELLHPSK